MTAREEALALLRERFPEPWRVAVLSAEHRWSVRVQLGQVFADAFGDTPQEAARACVAAWDEATKAERSAVVSAARAITSDAVDDMAAAGHRAVDIAMAAIAAERALADRLAEALFAIIGVADLDAALEDTDASENDAEAKGLRALGAWRAARGKA